MSAAKRHTAIAERAGKAADLRWRQWLPLDRSSDIDLQTQLRAAIADAISRRLIGPGMRLPSSRALAQTLGVARNTVTNTYRALAADGWITASARRAMRVAESVRLAGIRSEDSPAARQSIDWTSWLRSSARQSPQVQRPRNALEHRYPFIYGEVDPQGFPQREWRRATIDSLRPQSVSGWARDRIDDDDPELVAQIIQRLLPRRGIRASAESVLITLGAQHAMALLAAVLARGGTPVGLESPGYPDAWNVWSFAGAQPIALPIDESGLRPTRRLARCRIVQVSPSHQNPTTVTMPAARRHALLQAARAHDLILIEDDYDPELAFDGAAYAAIKSMDDEDRVVYIGSLSKTLAPGLRMGFVVGAPELIEELRAVRRLMVRHPPGNNQRALALFLSQGHHDAAVRRLVQTLARRARLLCEALDTHLPQLRYRPPAGGAALWAELPAGCDTSALARIAAARGLLFDAGAVFWRGVRTVPRTHLRLGYGSIPDDRIEAGIIELARLVDRSARPLNPS